MRLRKRVAFERFLVRLGVAAPGQWVLKGAFALDLRLGRSRTTRDIDLATVEQQPAMMDALYAACQVPLDDFFTFEARRTNTLDRAVGFNAVRYSVSAELAGRRFEQFPLDVASEEPPVLEPEWIRASDTLGFADIDPAEIPVVALEQQLAEKVHAYTGRYGAAGHESSRAKDLIDVVLISDLAELDVARLRSALETTFDRRDQQPLPANLPAPPGNWSVAYANLARSRSADRPLAGTPRGSELPRSRADRLCAGELGSGQQALEAVTAGDTGLTRSVAGPMLVVRFSDPPRMRGKAHAVIGLAAAAPIAAVSPDTGLVALATGVLGGLVPDLDHPDSVIGRCIPWPTVREGWRTGRWRPGGVIWHRGEVHSVGCAVLASLLAGVVAATLTKTVSITAPASAGFLLGYLSHLVADLLSPSPQMLLWPVSRRCWRPAWLPAAKVESLAGLVLERAASVVALGIAFVALRNVVPELVGALARLLALPGGSGGAG